MKHNPDWYDRFKCLQCEKSGRETDCCQLRWRKKEGKNAGKDPSERAMNSILPTVGQIAKGVAESLTWCTVHNTDVLTMPQVDATDTVSQIRCTRNTRQRMEQC